VLVTGRTLERARDQERYPSWAPDGKSIVFASVTSGNWDLWVASVDEGSAARTQLTADSTGEWSPSWSPNGRWIAFVSDRGGNLDIYVMPAAGGAAIQLTKNPGTDNMPAWSHDGRRILYSGVRDEESGIWVMDGLADVLGRDFAAAARE
jgi:TolB protein